MKSSRVESRPTRAQRRSATAEARARTAEAPAAEARSQIKPTRAFLLDEAAAQLNQVVPAKMVLCVFAALVAGLILAPSVCLSWGGGGLLLAALGWLATRAQRRGEPIGWRRRGLFAANFLAENLWWLVLGVLFWRTGTTAGQATGGALFLGVTALFVLLFYTAPAVFLAAGAAPSLAALTVIAFSDGRDWRQLAPIWAFLALGLVFSLSRAAGTPSAQESRRRLNASLDQYRILAENVTDVIARTDLKGAHQYVSPASLALLGYRPEELIDMPRAGYLHTDSDATMARGLRRMLAEPARSQILLLQVRHKDGRWLWLQTSAKLVCEGGVPVGVIGVSRDVTERVAADEALLKAKSEAEAANQAKAEFLANVSHEIRTPMNGVLGALHLLERESISPEGRELMRQANDCGRMLSQLLNDILDFSKIEAGQLDMSPEPMNAGEALQGVAALLAGQARAKGVALRCEITGESLWIMADPVRLRQAMFNLLGNAVKFTTEGHVTARLAVTSASPGLSRLRLEVEDSGIGMTADAQSHLFERFRQAEGNAARRFGGAGLGLSITRSLVRAMGGDVRFSSVEAQGSIFWFEFDVLAAEVVAAPPVETGLLDGVNILLVEDNPTNRLVARTMLTRLGASVMEAEDGVSGLAAARGGAHDLILMDIQMPHMDGVEATRAIRGLAGAASQVPIIGLTANAMVHQRAQYLAAGMNGVVAKPISPAQLLGEIARVLAEPETRLAS